MFINPPTHTPRRSPAIPFIADNRPPIQIAINRLAEIPICRRNKERINFPIDANLVFEGLEFDLGRRDARIVRVGVVADFVVCSAVRGFGAFGGEDCSV
jgi:hypothetical protein